MTKANRFHRESLSLSAVSAPSQSRLAAIESKKEKWGEPDIRETEFCLLPDGRVLDLIRSSRGASGMCFLVWQNGTVREVSQMEHARELLIPPRIDPTIVSALSLAFDREKLPGYG